MNYEKTLPGNIPTSSGTENQYTTLRPDSVPENQYYEAPPHYNPSAPNYNPPAPNSPVPPYSTPLPPNTQQNPGYVGQPPQNYVGPPFQQTPQYFGQPVIMHPPVTVTWGDHSCLSFTMAIIVSCVVFWFYGLIFGLIAFILAVIGQNEASKGNAPSARTYLKASYICSIIGIVIPVIIVVIILCVVLTSQSTTYYNPYYYYYGK